MGFGRGAHLADIHARGDFDQAEWAVSIFACEDREIVDQHVDHVGSRRRQGATLAKFGGAIARHVILNSDFCKSEAGQAMIRRIKQRRLGRLEDLDGAPLL